MPEPLLTVIFGIAVRLSLGLTGGGGSELKGSEPLNLVTSD